MIGILTCCQITNRINIRDFVDLKGRASSDLAPVIFGEIERCDDRRNRVSHSPEHQISGDRSVREGNRIRSNLRDAGVEGQRNMTRLECFEGSTLIKR